MSKRVINTDQAPAAIGTYSQAVIVGDTVYLSGQLGMDPQNMTLRSGFEAQAVQVFENLQAVARAAGGELVDAVKLTVYLVDLADFPTVNEVMGRYFDEPYPARAAVQVAALPKGAEVEIEGILSIG